jgi:hypothetical protein
MPDGLDREYVWRARPAVATSLAARTAWGHCSDAARGDELRIWRRVSIGLTEIARCDRVLLTDGARRDGDGIAPTNGRPT